MSTKGSMTHWDVLFLAGQKNATNGKAGVWAVVLDSGRETSLLVFVVWEGSFFFFHDLCGIPGVVIWIATLSQEGEVSVRMQCSDRVEYQLHLRHMYLPRHTPEVRY